MPRRSSDRLHSMLDHVLGYRRTDCVPEQLDGAVRAHGKRIALREGHGSPILLDQEKSVEIALPAALHDGPLTGRRRDRADRTLERSPLVVRVVMNEEGVVVRVVLATEPAPPPGALVLLLGEVGDRYPVALVEFGAALEIGR